MNLKNLLLGWLLIAGMILYATVLTVAHVGRTVIEVVKSFCSGEVPTMASR